MSYINLRGTRITDADLADLSELSDVDVLDLSDTRVSDSGLRHLKTLTRLVLLVLDGTQVTPAGVDELRGALPGIAVLYTKVVVPGEAAAPEKKSSGDVLFRLPVLPVAGASSAERC